MPVNTTHADYDNFKIKWKRCRDVSKGQDAVHDAGETYLPRLKEQAQSDYENYKKRSTFYNATWRTISGLVGMMLRQPPAIEAPQSVIDLITADVDGAGKPMQLFAQETCENALEVGRLGILVDCSPIIVADGATPTMADSAAQNIRPTLQMYSAETIINWRTGRVANATVLIMVVLQESVVDAEDEFKGKMEDRWRVLDLADNGAYRQRLYKKKVPVVADNVEFEQVGSDIFPTCYGKAMGYIPFMFLGTDDTTSDVDEPPLIDLVNLNIAHYRVTADYEHGCHFTGLPTLFLSGFRQENTTDKVYIGSEAAIISSNENARAEYVEFSGAGLGALEKNLASKETQMAILGARMLEPQQRAKEAADSQSIKRKGEESMLASVAQAISLGLTQALKWFTEFAGHDSSNVKFVLNRDFYPAPMTPAELSGLVMAWQQGAISEQTLFAKLQQGEIIDRDTTFEEEQARILAKQQQMLQQQIDAQSAAIDAGVQPNPQP